MSDTGVAMRTRLATRAHERRVVLVGGAEQRVAGNEQHHEVGGPGNCCQYSLAASLSTWVRLWRARARAWRGWSPLRGPRWRRGRRRAALGVDHDRLVAGSRTTRWAAAGRRPETTVVCSWKSQCPTMQAVSTNRRSCSSPKAPRRMPAQRREGCRLGAHSRLRRPAPELLGDVAVGVLAGRSMASPGHQPPTDSPSGRTRATKAVALGQLSQACFWAPRGVGGEVEELAAARARASAEMAWKRCSISSAVRSQGELLLPRPRTARARTCRHRAPGRAASVRAAAASDRAPFGSAAGAALRLAPEERARARAWAPAALGDEAGGRFRSAPDDGHAPIVTEGVTTTRSPPHPTEGGVRTRRPAPGVVAAGGRPHPGRAPAPARSSASEAAAVDRDPLVGPRTAPRRHEEAHETATSSGVQTWPNGLPGPGGERRRPTHPSLALPPHLRDPPARRDHVDVHAVGALLRARCGRGLHGGLGML